MLRRKTEITLTNRNCLNHKHNSNDKTVNEQFQINASLTNLWNCLFLVQGRPCVRTSTTRNSATNNNFSCRKYYTRFKRDVFNRPEFQLTHIGTFTHFTLQYIRPVTDRSTVHRRWRISIKSKSLSSIIILITSGIIVRPTTIKMSAVMFEVFKTFTGMIRVYSVSFHCIMTCVIHVQAFFFLFRYNINAIKFPIRTLGTRFIRFYDNNVK